MSRICPKCKAKLGGYDRFFCTACGEALPADLVDRDGVFSRIANFAASSKEKTESKVNPKVVKGIIFALLTVGLLVGLGIFIKSRLNFTLFKPQETVTESSNSTPTEYSKNVVEVPLSWEINTFGIDGILESVPFNSDIVIEGNDLAKFATAYSAIDPTYKDLSTFINGKVEQHFVLFAKRNGDYFEWSLIYQPLRTDYKVDGGLVTKYEKLKFWSKSPFALITSSDETLTEVSDTVGKTNKNFTQTPIYATSRLSSPRNGKLFIYLLSKESKDYFKTLKSLPNLSKELQTVVESVTKENSDYSIIL